MRRNRDRVRAGLTASVGGASRGRALADQLCSACIELLDVQGAALWLVPPGRAPVSLSRCGAVTAGLDRAQLSSGQGPCWDAINTSTLVSAPDLHTADPSRWSPFTRAATEAGIRAVFAVPVTVSGVPTGVLYLCRARSGGLAGPALAGAFLAGELAVLPLLDMVADTRTPAVEPTAPVPRDEYGWLTRAEIYQAVGMIAAQLGVHPTEALLRLRGYAFANDLTANQVAFLIIERRLHLEDDGAGRVGRPELGWPELGGEL